MIELKKPVCPCCGQEMKVDYEMDACYRKTFFWKCGCDQKNLSMIWHKEEKKE